MDVDPDYVSFDVDKSSDELTANPSDAENSGNVSACVRRIFSCFNVMHIIQLGKKSLKG